MKLSKRIRLRHVSLMASNKPCSVFPFRSMEQRKPHGSEEIRWECGMRKCTTKLSFGSSLEYPRFGVQNLTQLVIRDFEIRDSEP